MSRYAIAAGTLSAAPVRSNRRMASTLAGVLALVAAAGLIAGCDRAPDPGLSHEPIPATSAAPTGEAVADSTGKPAAAPAAEAGGGDTGDPGGNSAEGAGQPPAAAQPLELTVITEPATTQAPCYPAGSILVEGGEYPLAVTYEWYYLAELSPKPGAPKLPTRLGEPQTLHFNVSGGIAVSAEKLPAADGHQVQLRVVSPQVVVGAWVAHPACAG